MSRNLFGKPIYKVQISGAIGWSDLKQRVVRHETVEFASRKDAEKAAKELNPGEYTQGRIRVVPVELSEDYDIYPTLEKSKPRNHRASSSRQSCRILRRILRHWTWTQIGCPKSTHYRLRRKGSICRRELGEQN